MTERYGSQAHGSHICILFANAVADRRGKNHPHDIGSLPHCQVKPAQHKRDPEEGDC